MDIVVKGRKTEVPDRFRQHAAEKLERVTKLDGKVISVDVELTKERNPRQADRSDQVEITLRTKGPVIRAEACAADPYAALDLASTKLDAQLRKVADRRRTHKGRTPTSTAAAALALTDDPAVTAPLSAMEAQPEVDGGTGGIAVDGDGPMVVREKTHAARPITLDQALHEMELVGHDFYLYVDSDAGTPSVVYRRHAYDYGVIHLKMED